MKFIVTATHTQGASVGHPCKTGVYGDPTDGFQYAVDAGSTDDARNRAVNALDLLVGTWQQCQCRFHRKPGYRSWWESVVFEVWPQDREALEDWLKDGGDITCDPYQLIPKELK